MGKRNDLTGKRFGKLTVIGFAGRANDGHAMWRCKCDCGNYKNVRSNLLVCDMTQSCGCSRQDVGEKNGIDETGNRYGALTVIERVANIDGKWAFLCKCDCGEFVEKQGCYLRNSIYPNCGCKRREAQITHGMTGTRIYRIWFDMKRRCYKPNNKSYSRYGGRGITVCDEWRNNFEAFYNWAMDNGYNDNLSIDRINPNGNYEPINCRWITMSEQAKNRRNCHFITCNGRTQILADWAKETGIDRFEIVKRLKNGQTPEQALECEDTNG